MIERKYTDETRAFNAKMDAEVLAEQEEERVNDILAKYLNEDGIDYLWDKYGTELYGKSELEIQKLVADYFA